MADIIFRLPGKEQYSYAEVSVSQDEVSGDEGAVYLTEILENALSALNAVYPNAGAVRAASTPQDAPPVAAKSNGAETTCVHGNRTRVAKANWVAWFCPQPKDAADQCKASFEKRN